MASRASGAAREGPVLEAIDLKKKVSKEAFRAELPALQQRLWELQRQAFEASLPAIIVLEGWASSGKGEAIARLAERLDPRGIKVHAIFPPTDEERHRPFLWRFWMRLPERGRIALFHRSWYERVLDDRVAKLVSGAEARAAREEIVQFERMLARDGMVFVKLWLHISEKEQRRRLKELEESEFERWRLEGDAEDQRKKYDKYLDAAEEMLADTSTTEAPWTVIEATDREYRLLKTFKTVGDALQRALAARAARPAAAARPPRASITVAALRDQPGLLDRVDLTQRLDEETYERELPKWQTRLRELQLRCHRAGLAVVVVYEGWDAAGKGGNIRRVTERLDPRGYTVVPVAKPEGDEATHHYLWRFWRRLPRAGFLTIFDRSWYGRVLVERVEGFAADEEWERGYQEIREFERSLTNAGTVVVKFWLHLSPAEQLRRFEERRAILHKQHKLTDEDWRNRDQRGVYEPAVARMLQETSTANAPWTIVEAEDKRWARVRALRALCDRLEGALDAADRAEGKGKKKKKKKS
jgi:polyphosphate:AMP phosphotransferase